MERALSPSADPCKSLSIWGWSAQPGSTHHAESASCRGTGPHEGCEDALALQGCAALVGECWAPGRACGKTGDTISTVMWRFLARDVL